MLVQFLASNLAIGIVLIGTLLGLVVLQRHALADIFTARGEPGWRLLARLGAGATVALALWGTLADSWRKLLGEALDVNERFLSQRAVPEPVPRDIRVVTLVLLAASLLALAPLFARHIGGYLLQVAVVIAGFAAFIPLYLLRQRLDTGLAGIVELPPIFSPAMLATILFLLADYAINVALLLTSYLGLLGLVALPVTLVLDLLNRREPRVAAEPSAFYQELHTRVLARRDDAPRREDGEAERRE